MHELFLSLRVLRSVGRREAVLISGPVGGTPKVNSASLCAWSEFSQGKAWEETMPTLGKLGQFRLCLRNVLPWSFSDVTSGPGKMRHLRGSGSSSCTEVCHTIPSINASSCVVNR